MKNVLSTPWRLAKQCVTHIKQSKATTAPSHVLAVCTHIICHTALSVMIAWWEHQAPPWEQLCCIMCGKLHSSASAPPPNTIISQCEEAICHAAKVAHRIPVKHVLRIVFLLDEL